MGERRGDGMTAFKTAMNQNQSFLQTNTNNWNIVESGVEHHNPNYCTFYGSILELFNLYDHHNSKNLDIPKG
jgi:hypothetical protein